MDYFDKEPQLLKKEKSKLRRYLGKGMTAFLVIVAALLFYFALLRFTSIRDAFQQVLKVLTPIIYGFVIAFLLNPIVKRVERVIKPWLEKHLKKEGSAQRTARGIGIFVALVLALAAVIALFNMLIPELYRSISDLIMALPAQVSEWGDSINAMLEQNQNLDKMVKTVLLEGSNAIEEWAKTDLIEWAQTDLLKQADVLLTSVTVGVISVINVVMDLLIGIIVSVYVLFSKEKFANQSKKVVYALTSSRRANIIIHIARKANEIFSGFIIGKIIDSAIIGVLCFIGLSILNMPYTLLVSVIVGVTNVIPFFGPYIGAIPSAILILLVDPIKGIYFIIFILVLQQLDGNVIGPKILGNSTGLSSFWVIFSILVAGGLFGVVGMIMGVPTFALIYYVAKMFINQKLEQKNLPTSTDSYKEKNYVDEIGVFVSVENDIIKEEEEDADSRTK